MPGKQFDVLVAGELNIDMILDQLDRFPVLGKEIMAQKITVTLGSSSAIFAANLSSLGASVAFCGRVGNDSFADKILTDLAAKGVDTKNIVRSVTADTGITVAFNVEQNRAMVTYPGAMNELKASDINSDMLMGATHLHVSSVFIQPALKPGLTELFRRAKQLGITTSLDPQWDPAEAWDCDWGNLLPFVDVFLPNREELKYISKRSSIEEAVSAIKGYANIIVVKNSTEGATIFHQEEIIYQPAFINNDFADAIGAGDSFNSGFISRFIQNQPLQLCAEYGAVCGAINTTANGGTTAFADIDAIRKIALEKFNYTLL